ncbi:hypothetical protein [Mucilaginibacter aquariorum]|uniref:Uncharacterized protein n=1 Tax=Mucilaginibacter aquariorum TaxID=2967225 RepID=A0ABT1TAP4_9SPHI|nr:hypothetical protein [Mucilaginibacter aquariorum]MCQ6961543.1 hypothetical protein [Mucilaginibacter aquariorum]
MPGFQTGYVIGFHSCDKEVGLRLLNGTDELLPSDNPWDWLGPGSYFWEQDAERALQYATETAAVNKKIKLRLKSHLLLGQ